jgi:hypothetical protein
MTIGPPIDNIKLQGQHTSGQDDAAAHLVTRMKIFPRSRPNFSLADSEAEVEHAGYSPPTPTPVIPRATVSIQNMPAGAEISLESAVWNSMHSLAP